MNTATHLVTGMLLARLFTNRRTGERTGHGEFAVLFTGVAALLPDLDSVLGLPHAQATHTGIGAILLAVAWAGVAWLAGRSFVKQAGIGFTTLLLLSLAGVASHLVLDTFTYYKGNCLNTAAHLYFWPLWTQSFHMDCFFGTSDQVYLARVLVEWAVYTPALLVVLVHRRLKWKENPFAAFSVRSWFASAGLPPFREHPASTRAGAVLLLVLSLGVIIVQAIGYVT